MPAVTEAQRAELDAMIARHALAHGIALARNTLMLARRIAHGEHIPYTRATWAREDPEQSSDRHAFLTSVEFSAQLMREEWAEAAAVGRISC